MIRSKYVGYWTNEVAKQALISALLLMLCSAAWATLHHHDVQHHSAAEMHNVLHRMGQAHSHGEVETNTVKIDFSADAKAHAAKSFDTGSVGVADGSYRPHEATLQAEREKYIAPPWRNIDRRTEPPPPKH